MLKILKQVDIGDQRFITVCAWCCPGESIFQIHPHLRGNVQITHGICPAHKEEMMNAIRSLPTQEGV